VEHADALHGEVSVRQQRFADVIARELFFFQQDDISPFNRQRCRGSGTGGTAADHDCVVVHLLFSGSRMPPAGGRISKTCANLRPVLLPSTLRRPKSRAGPAISKAWQIEASASTSKNASGLLKCLIACDS